MRKRAAAAAATASLSVLAIGWYVGSPTIASLQNTLGGAGADVTVTAATAAASTTPSADPSATAAPSASATPVAAPAATAVSGTFTGSVVATRFGNMQVSVTIADGTITDVTALQLTDKDSRSVQISNRAAPVLRSEVLAAQSASVANVSGATYTTEGYLTSLQAALDRAGF